jgi:uncharacterized membrane protein YuzA (DUF378 family)
VAANSRFNHPSIRMKLHAIAFILVIIGGLNWGLVALGSYMGSNWNVVNLILGSWPAVETIVYLLVGLSALSLLISHKGDCRACSPV